MAGNENTGVVNPLDSGNDPNSVEASAADFTRMLEAEAAPKDRPRRKSETVEPAPRNAAPEDGDPSPAPRDPAPDGDEPRSEPDDDLFVDPVLDTPAPKKADEESEDDPEDKPEGDEEKQELDLDDIDLEALYDKEFEVVVAGETQALPLKEILAGYSREADYRQKTARLSEERQEVEAFAQETVEQRQRYETQIQTFLDMAKVFEPSKEDWDKLRTANPQMYIETKEQWEQISKKAQDAEAERVKIAEETAKGNLRAYNDYVRSENDKLFQAIPALANPEKAKQFRNALFAYGKKAGYTDDELAKGLVDHRDIQTMYKAARYDQIVAARKGGDKGKGKGKGNPVPAPSSQPRVISRRAGPQGNRNVRSSERRLAETGSTDDAAMAFTSLINSGRI